MTTKKSTRERINLEHKWNKYNDKIQGKHIKEGNPFI